MQGEFFPNRFVRREGDYLAGCLRRFGRFVFIFFVFRFGCCSFQRFCLFSFQADWIERCIFLCLFEFGIDTLPSIHIRFDFF